MTNTPNDKESSDYDSYYEFNAAFSELQSFLYMKDKGVNSTSLMTWALFLTLGLLPSIFKNSTLAELQNAGLVFYFTILILMLIILAFLGLDGTYLGRAKKKDFTSVTKIIVENYKLNKKFGLALEITASIVRVILFSMALQNSQWTPSLSANFIMLYVVIDVIITQYTLNIKQNLITIAKELGTTPMNLLKKIEAAAVLKDRV